jgi:hypothetical protein
MGYLEAKGDSSAFWLIQGGFIDLVPVLIREPLPEGLVLKIPGLRVRKLLLTHCEVHAAGGERATFTPPITIIVDTRNELRVLSKPLDILFIHNIPRILKVICPVQKNGPWHVESSPPKRDQIEILHPTNHPGDSALPGRPAEGHEYISWLWKHLCVPRGPVWCGNQCHAARDAWQSCADYLSYCKYSIFAL